jgi:hypothetical protein
LFFDLIQIKFDYNQKMKPFDHVTIADMEFMIWYKNKGSPMLPNGGDEWYALDQNKEKVGICTEFATLLPSQCTYWCEWVHKPRFFGERLIDGEWHQFEIKNAQMRSEVENDMLKGRFTIKGVVWKWNIQDLTLFKNEERWLLRIMTPGGYWL